MNTNNKTTSIRIEAEPDLYENLLAEKENHRKNTGKSIALSKIILEICRKWFKNGHFDQNSVQNFKGIQPNMIPNTGFEHLMPQKIQNKEKELRDFEHSLLAKGYELSERERNIMDLINEQLVQKNQLIDFKQSLFEKELDNRAKLRRLDEVEKELYEKNQIITKLTRELKENEMELRQQRYEQAVPEGGVMGFINNIKDYLPVINSALLGYIVYMLNKNGKTQVDENAIGKDIKSFLGDFIELVKTSKNKSSDEILQEVIKKYEKRNAEPKSPKR